MERGTHFFEILERNLVSRKCGQTQITSFVCGASSAFHESSFLTSRFPETTDSYMSLGCDRMKVVIGLESI